MAETVPGTKLLIRTREGLQLLHGLPSSSSSSSTSPLPTNDGKPAVLTRDESFPNIPDVEITQFSSDGKYLACGYPGGVQVVDLDTNTVVCTLDVTYSSGGSSSSSAGQNGNGGDGDDDDSVRQQSNGNGSAPSTSTSKSKASTSKASSPMTSPAVTAGKGAARLPTVKAMHFSPLGTYLLTWQNPMKAVKSGGQSESSSGASGGGGHLLGNLVVWAVGTGAEVMRTHQKSFDKGKWPTLQWTSDEEIAMRGMDNEVQVYAGHKLKDGLIDRLSLPKLGGMSVSPGPAPYRFSSFIPEVKGKPGRVSMHSYPFAQGGGALDSKSTFRAEECEFQWSPTGKAVLALTSTVVDATGASYYGATGLFLLHADGSFSASVQPPKEGPVHDFGWAPGGTRFAVIAGTMPTQTNLYNLHGEATFQFGQAPRNTLSWSPHGRFLLVAGFGNLAGGVDYWEANKLKKMGSGQAHCAVQFGWSPDSRYFMTATCAPRMNVDNCYEIFGYDGIGPLAREDFEQLLEATWRPAKPETYPDRPMSPGRGKITTSAEGGAEKKAGSSLAALAASSSASGKPQAYRPPGASGSMAAMMRKEREGDTAAKKIVRSGDRGAASSSSYAPPPPPSNSAKRKAAKKKAEAKAKEDADAAAAVTTATTAAAAKPPPSGEGGPGGDAADAAKRAKQINKKLSQIVTIKEKVEKGEALNDDQKSKLAMEEALRQELEGLKL